MNKTLSEYNEMIKGFDSLDEYLRVSPASKTALSALMFYISVSSPIFFDRNRYSRSVLTYSHCVVFTNCTCSMRKCFIRGARGGIIDIEPQRLQTQSCERLFFPDFSPVVLLASSARELATDAGWNLEGLLNTSTFSSLYRSHNACLEAISKDGKHSPSVS